MGDVLGKALSGEPVSDLDDRDDVAIVLACQVEGAADMVGVTVRDRDQVDALGLLLAVRTLRVFEPGIDVDALPARRVEAEGGVAEPGEWDVGHASSFRATRLRLT